MSGKGATVGGLVQDSADITPLTRPKPYRALALSTPSMTCLERRGGSVHAMAVKPYRPRVPRSLECLQESRL
jgi:hypothetical protein